MTEKENRQEGENYQSGRDGYKSYNNREGYNKYNRGERGNGGYERRPRFNSNSEERPQRPYRITIRVKREAIVRNVLRIIPVSIIEKTEANNVLTVPVITMGNKVKAVIVRNVLHIIPVIIRMRMVNNVRIVRAIITGNQVKAVIARHVRIIRVNREIMAVRKEDARVLPIIIRMLSIVRKSKSNIKNSLQTRTNRFA